jgi:hypothetical protein
MTEPTKLKFGDVLHTSILKNYCTLGNDNFIEFQFNAGRGKVFQVLFLGTSEKKNLNLDPEKALNDLGFYRKERSSKPA